MYRIWLSLSFTQQEQINDELIALIAYVIFVALLLSVMVILFFITFQKRKHKILQEKFEQQKRFDEEISKTQTEIQEQTLKHVGWELHDNVGQLLAYASMQLKTLSGKIPAELQSKVDETSDIVKDSLKEVRALSKSLNNEVILDLGLEDAIANELNRLERMKFSSATMTTNRASQSIENKKHEIVLFRILQEFFSNAVKYAEAEAITVDLNYLKDALIITAKDNGIGFDMSSTKNGSGLINMKSRAELIGANFNLESQIDQGVTLTLNYPLSTLN